MGGPAVTISEEDFRREIVAAMTGGPEVKRKLLVDKIDLERSFQEFAGGYADLIISKYKEDQR